MMFLRVRDAYTTDRFLPLVRRKVGSSCHVEIQAIAGGARLRIRGNPRSTDLVMAAISAGFDLRSAQSRTFTASGPTADEDVARLREALGKIPDVEDVQVQATAGAVTARVQGDVKVSAIVSAAKSAGFELRQTILYVASGPSADPDRSRLREALGKVPRVEQVEVSSVAGGATVRIQGSMEEETLLDAAKIAGFALQTAELPSGVRLFRLNGTLTTDDEDRLRKTLQGLSGIGMFRILKSPGGSYFGVLGGTVTPENIAAAVKAVGFDAAPSNGAGIEQSTPPAYAERVTEDLTKVGDVAPDFTLITQDGKSKISLSDYRGKRSVVLIFGSYT